jgi:hypothetical protein
MYKITKEQISEIMQVLTMGAYPNVTVGKINEIINKLNNLPEEKVEEKKVKEKK